MHLFYQKFAEGYIIVKYRSSLILVTIHKILVELWPIFNLVFVVRLQTWTNPYGLHNFDTFRGILLIFDRDEEDQ